MRNLTHDRLKELFSYDEETGKFSRIVRCGRMSVGVVDNVPAFFGYIYIAIDGSKYMAHRLAWFYVHGEWPKEEIDHIDGDKTNNKISNLRVATRCQNEANKPSYRNGSTKIKGVTWDKTRCKWFSHITQNGKMKNLGRFDCFGKALSVRISAARAQHGEFFRAA
jgi:hypothetical protein